MKFGRRVNHSNTLISLLFCYVFCVVRRLSRCQGNRENLSVPPPGAVPDVLRQDDPERHLAAMSATMLRHMQGQDPQTGEFVQGRPLQRTESQTRQSQLLLGSCQKQQETQKLCSHHE